MPWTASLTINVLLVLLAVLALFAVAIVAVAVWQGGRREDPIDADAIAGSRFTLPVSIIVPVAGNIRGVSETLHSLLALNYPQIEVIIVAEQIGAEAAAALAREWELTPKEYFYRRAIETSAVQRIFESARDERLIVVHKDVGGRADLLNCGLSLARFRYVATVAPGIVLDANALLRLMSPALRDPADVVAVTSHVERGRSAGVDGANPGAVRRPWASAATDWQRIRSVRVWLASRISFSRVRCGVAFPDTVVAWRRDMLIEAGGFSRIAFDPEQELLIRLQTSSDPQLAGHVVRTSEIVGCLQAVGLGEVARRANLRQHAVLEAAAALWRAPLRTDGRVAASCFVLAELITPLAQRTVILAVLSGAIIGWFPWIDLLLVIVLLSFGNAAVTAAALLVRGAVPGGPGFTALARLLMLAPAEYVVYRPAVALARIRRPKP